MLSSILRSMAMGLLLVANLAGVAQAAPYGQYDLGKLLKPTENENGRKYQLDHAFVDRVLTDLMRHAGDYPTQFDSQSDQQRAQRDSQLLRKLFGEWAQAPQAHPELLYRAAMLGSIGHNLNQPGAAAQADAFFQKLLVVEPAHRQGLYRYGLFLASTGQPQTAIPWLEKAIAAGVEDGYYTLSLSYLALGKTQQAIDAMEKYRAGHADDKRADDVLDAMRNGKFQIKAMPGK